MENHIITNENLQIYKQYLYREERAANTVEKYLHELQAFLSWAGACEVTKELVSRWKEYLVRLGRSAGTVNSSLSALHSFFGFMNWTDCRVKYMKIQRKMFRDASKELTREEYQHLVMTAEKRGDMRLALLLETICATGVRVSELKYITVEAVRRGRADIFLKGKVRTILIPRKLVYKLQKYAKKKKIHAGEVFVTKNGTGMSRRQIWGQMKSLCRESHVDETKVFPHNLRHLFARAYYKICKDIVRLADVLGHSSVETTRIYLISTGEEHRKYLEELGLVS